MKTEIAKDVRRRAVLFFLCLVVGTGCATPNLSPFADATSEMASAGRKTGEITRAELERREALRPAAGNPPSAKFVDSWKPRRKAFDDIEEYAGALAALGGASSNSKSNVARVVGSLQELASNVPGYGSGFNAAGDVLITVGQTVIEVKAYRTAAKLVEATHPVVKEVVGALEKDLDELKVLYASLANAQLRALKNEAEGPQTYLSGLTALRDELRTRGTNVIEDAAQRQKLALLDSHIAVVAPEVDEAGKRIAARKRAIDDGIILFEQARETLGTWLRTHEQLHSALTAKQVPNVALLVARTQELKAAADQLRKSQSP
jgi:hypothetical protein